MKYSQEVKKHNGYSWFSDECNIIYLGIPKTASTSMRQLFKIDRNFMNLKNIPEGKEGYRTFTIIRNPLNRFVSGVVEAFKRSETPRKIMAIEKIGDEKKMLEAFVTILEEEFIETHTAPQIAFFYNENGEKFSFNDVLIFENLKEDFENMCKNFGISKELMHRHRGEAVKQNRLRQIINDDPILLNRVNELYKDDWVLYNEISKQKEDERK